jgi:hypothetical protein
MTRLLWRFPSSCSKGARVGTRRLSALPPGRTKILGADEHTTSTASSVSEYRHLTQSRSQRSWRASYEMKRPLRAKNQCAVGHPQMRQDAAPNPGQGLVAIWAWRRALFAFRRAGCQAVHLIDQLARGLDAVLQAFILRASYVDLSIAPTKLEPCATSPAHH